MYHYFINERGRISDGIRYSGLLRIVDNNIKRDAIVKVVATRATDTITETAFPIFACASAVSFCIFPCFPNGLIVGAVDLFADFNELKVAEEFNVPGGGICGLGKGDIILFAF